MNARAIIEAAIERILYPVIKLLIDAGVSYNHFARIARRIFVKIASQKIENEVEVQRNDANAALRRILLEYGKSAEEIEEIESDIETVGELRAVVRRELRAKEVKESAIQRIVDSLPHVGKVTSTRTAMLTGIPRKDIPELLNESIEDVGDDQWYRHRCGKVLSDWWRTAAFTDDKGRPKPLWETKKEARAAKERQSFESLVERGWSDLSPTAVLEELLDTGCVQRTKDGRLIAVKQRYARIGIEPNALLQAADRMYSMAESVNSKLRMGDDSPLEEGAVITLQTSSKHRPIILNRLRKLAESFLNSVQGLLKNYEVEDGEESVTLRMGAGVYTVEGDEMAESKLFKASQSISEKAANE